MKEKRTLSKKTIAWWVYLIVITILAFWGLRDSGGAEALIRALHDAFTLLME